MMTVARLRKAAPSRPEVQQVEVEPPIGPTVVARRSAVPAARGADS